jgi:hypothetical protein
MKKNLSEEIERINQLIDEAEKLTLGQKVKLNPMSFIMKFKDDFINYFNRIADAVNRPDFCENVGAVSQQAVNSLKSLINTISKESGISDAQLIDYVMGQLNSGLAQSAIKMAQDYIPSDNTVPKEILDAVVKYLKSQYPEEGPGLVTAIYDIIKKLNQPVQSFCQGSSMRDLSDTQANYGELRQTAPKQIQSKGATQLPTNQAKPNLNTQPALQKAMGNQTPKPQQPKSDTVKGFEDSAKKMADLKIGGTTGVKQNTLGNYTAKTSQNTGNVAQEKNRPIQNVVNKVKDKIKNLRGGQGPATA